MERIEIKMPGKFEFATEIPICINHISFANHLDNAAVLSLVHEARIRFLRNFGFKGEFEIEGRQIIIRDAAILYRSEAFHGDVLKIEVGVSGFDRFGCDFFYKLSNKETGREVARAKTGVLFFNYEKREKIEVPEKFKSLFTEQ